MQLQINNNSLSALPIRYTVLVRRYQNQGISLPGAIETQNTFSPTRQSVYSGTDDDSSSYAPSVNMYDELLPTQTQVSTPETHSSWSFDEEPFTSWPSQENFSTTAGPSDFASPHQQSHLNASRPGTWGWPATTMDHPSTMSLATAAYSTGLSPPSVPSYGPYGAMQNIFGPTSAPSNGAGSRSSYTGSPVSPIVQPRSSPVLSSAAAYHDPEAMARFMRYKAQATPLYQMK